MNKKFVLTTIVTFLLLSLVPFNLVISQDDPPQAEQALDLTDIDFGLIGDNELWLKSGTDLYYTQNAGSQWSLINPKTDLIEPYLYVSYPTSMLGFALYLAQTETAVEVEIYKTATQGETWTDVTGNLEQKLNDQFDHPFGEIQMQWLDEKNAMVLVKESTSSNFSMGTLFVSTDGGKHWSPKEVPVAENFIFLDKQVGFMLNPTDSQSLYRTLNGGKSWTLLEVDLPEIMDSTLLEPGLPIKLADKRVYLPVKVTEGEYQGGDFMVKIEPKASPKSMIKVESLDVFPILPPSGQKQPSSNSASLIDKIQMQDVQNLWVSSSGGECESLQTVDGGSDITCESTWQLLRSQSGGLGWDVVRLPGELTSIKKTFSANAQLPETEIEQKQVEITASVDKFAGHAFDKCEIPTLSQLQRWYTSSPYRVVNLYIGGVSRYCSNSALTANYLKSMNLQGWRFIPTWVGPQAPCTSFKTLFPYDVNQAYQAGVDNANQARTKMMQLGLTNPNGTGGIIYLDLEYFEFTSSCSAAARAYVNGWTTRLSQLGIYSGLYSTSRNISDNRYYSITKPPSAVWIAEWHGTGFRQNETVWGLRHLSDGVWVNRQRILQYSGGHSETWGGVSMDIDCNVADGPVASPYGAYPYRMWFPFMFKRK